MFVRSLPVLGSLVLTMVAGCAAKSTSDASASDELVAGHAIQVSGAKAERLLNAFGLVDAVDHAMGGRASVDVKGLSVIASANSALDDTDPDFLVPSTVATFDDASESPSHRVVTDPRAAAAVLFGALADVDDSLADSAMGKTFVTASKVECDGHGPGAGDDPNNPPPTTATCTVTSEEGKTFSVDGAKALRIIQAFGLASPEAVDHAMGGRFGVAATNVSCERRSNMALDETDPLFEIPVHSCKADVTDAKPFSVDDKDPVAGALLKALEVAGLQADSAMGKTGVTSAHVTCSKGPGQPTACSLAR
jgi:hypothetical protein